MYVNSSITCNLFEKAIIYFSYEILSLWFSDLLATFSHDIVTMIHHRYLYRLVKWIQL